MLQSKFPTIQNKTLSSGDTEYSLSLPAATLNWSLNNPSTHDVRFAFEAGRVAGATEPYMTLLAGTSYTSPASFAAAVESSIVYLASSSAGVRVELISWGERL